ncbi:hypothetical protein DFJ74DRAFT_695944 [Hyaloraphidium curvatum]|nr:hypothetical protein DFJ74DRAFT_695944 [Hyaloraphidium curvatum]
MAQSSPLVRPAPATGVGGGVEVAGAGADLEVPEGTEAAGVAGAALNHETAAMQMYEAVPTEPADTEDTDVEGDGRGYESDEESEGEATADDRDEESTTAHVDLSAMARAAAIVTARFGTLPLPLLDLLTGAVLDVRGNSEAEEQAVLAMLIRLELDDLALALVHADAVRGVLGLLQGPRTSARPASRWKGSASASLPHLVPR